MKLILAQGNPGSQYDGTRHNTGFYMLDRYAADMGAVFKASAKFQAQLAESAVEGEKILLVKPDTYYNETGRSARALVDFYKLDPAQDVLVLHDELALPFGTVRVRSSGSDAGNNGIKSLNAALGQEYTRVRIGIYSPLRERLDSADFVTGKFSAEESAELPRVAELVMRQIGDFIAGKSIDATHKTE